jgi:hypothetical protein
VFEFLPTPEKWTSYFVIFSATIERPGLESLPDGNKETKFVADGHK